jgi:hypothetical protein
VRQSTRGRIARVLITTVWIAQAAAQAPAGPRAAAAVTLFEGARLIDGSGGPPIEDSAFLVVNTRFAEVGRRGNIRVPPGQSASI